VRCVAHGVPSAQRQVHVCVEDNGPGLGGRSTEEICAPFFSTKSEGMGMGLAICRSIMELHYGTLEARERREGGASLCFTLPVAEQAELPIDKAEMEA